MPPNQNPIQLARDKIDAILQKLRCIVQSKNQSNLDTDNAEPFGAIIDRIREQLSFFGKPRIKQKEHNNTVVYKILSEDEVPVKLKIEVNTREHFSVYGLQDIPVTFHSEWDQGEALVTTYELDELLATKLRALYQRKKGCDLFDIWYALNTRM